MTKYYVNMWSDLIPGLTNEQKKSMEYAGYYTALAREGLRIVSFNTVFGYVIIIMEIKLKCSCKVHFISNQRRSVEQVCVSKQVHSEVYV